MAGTLSCMAPELFRGATADARSDIWSLGVLLYEMATGKRPFDGVTGFELSGAILHEPPAPLPESIPASTRTIIMRCLEKNPAARYQNADDVHLALESAPADMSPRVAPPSRTRSRKAVISLALLAASHRLGSRDRSGVRRRSVCTGST